MLKSSQIVFESAAAQVRSVNRHDVHQRSAVRPGLARLAARPLVTAALAVSALGWSAWAAALGLGDITLRSALNQPLNAEIQLLETSGLNADDIVVRLAPPEAFAKAGIERVFFLNDLRFMPEVHGNRGVVRVVSGKAVTEPYLNFLVQLSRPNGDLLHEYTLLLDPATSPQGLAATRGRQAQNTAASETQSRLPVAPPPAGQGKRYQVAAGDTLNAIARRVQAPGGGSSVTQMAEGIRALNPQAFTDGATSGLRVGQSLLLPDTAVLPDAASASTAPAAELQRATEQLAASTLESQRLSRELEALTARAQALQEEMIGKDKEITALRADLAQAQAPVAQVQASATPAAPVAAQDPSPPVTVTPTPVSQDEPFLSFPLLLAIGALILLLIAYAFSKRRQARPLPEAPVAPQDDHLLKRAQTPVLPQEIPDVAPQPAPLAVAPQAPARPVTPPRPAGAAPDALDGVSIYIAYGRFNEALGILRNAMEAEPEREDIRIRILELLAEQGDVNGFAREEQSALDHGVEPHKIEEIRGRYPQLRPSETPKSASLIAPAAVLATPVVAAPEPDLQLDETTAAALNPESPDEFHLNLDDLSMDADWDLVDPFEPPPVPNKPVTAPATPEVDPAFSSNLNELPEVFELSDEQFLSDFDEPEPVVVKDDTPDLALQLDDDALSDEFLDSFMGDDSEFDLLELDEAPLTQINQAQILIDEGDFEAARDILNKVVEESDEQHRQMAREMLASIE